jgi:nicotinamide-nucleotide amidase
MSLTADPAEVLALCRAKRLTVATAESCTGGMVGAALTDIAGSSDVYERGVITYSNGAKIALLGVKPETLEAFGAVSEQVAREMAEGLLFSAPVDIAVSVTGIAGPGGSEHKPEGRVCFGLATRGACETRTVEFGALGRAGVRAAARDHALALIATAAQSA